MGFLYIHVASIAAVLALNTCADGESCRVTLPTSLAKSSPHVALLRGVQGKLGKFGAVELSDVAAFLELPDGRMLSGSEGGSLLLWEDGLIKVVLSRPGGRPCHEGAIELLLHDHQSNCVLTGGVDGLLRLWDYEHIMKIERENNKNTVEVWPSVEVALPEGTRVRGGLWAPGQWLIADEAGGLLKVSC